MFQSILFFVLGFLAAAFIALMAAPAIWRRAVLLTRRRIEASVPLSMNEIQADKDRLRAEYAMSTRRLEMNLDALKEKSAAQFIEINRNREELKRIAADRDTAGRTIAELEAGGEVLRRELQKQIDDVRRLTARIAETDRQLEERGREYDQLHRRYNETSLESSNRQIDLVAKETEVEKLEGDVTMLRSRRRDQEMRIREMTVEVRSAGEALKAEKKRANALEKRLEAMMTARPNREDRIEPREKELVRLREEVQRLTGTGSERTERQTHKAQLAGNDSRMQDMPVDDLGKATVHLDGERAKLEERLTILTRENRKLRENVAGFDRTKANGAGRESAALRDRIGELAAEVVSLTMKLDGPDSPIAAALEPAEDGANGQAVPDPAGKTPSIADRVRALQKAAPAPPTTP